MNTWNDFKACQPKINWPVNPVFVTDGKKVWFGRLSFWRRTLVFTGCNLQNGELKQVPVYDLTGWQPAPSSFQPGKTAAEMFQDAGYDEVDTRTNEKWYRKKFNDYSVTLIVDFDTQCVDCRTGRNTTPMEFSEVLAVAQLIREMEGDKDV